MWDTQHAVLFSQSLCMNAAELKLTLPWDPELWEADTPEEWHSLNSKAHSQPQYLSVLKTYINHRSTTRTPSLNALSRVLMLHGLMSVAWDLNRRDQTSLGTTPPFLRTSQTNNPQASHQPPKKHPGKHASATPTTTGRQTSNNTHAQPFKPYHPPNKNPSNASQHPISRSTTPHK